MEEKAKCKPTTLLCSPLIHLADESGEKYLYDWNLSRSIPFDKNFRVGECLYMGDVDCRCLYHREQDGRYKRMSDGLVVTFSKEDTNMSISLTTPDEELSDAAYCAKNGILGVGRHGQYFFTLEKGSEN